MVLSSVDVLVDALRETNLLRKEQFDRLVDEFLPQFEETKNLAKHIIKLGWITLYQAKKLLSGNGSDLVVGNYVVLDKIGEGGMGKVYKARQSRLNRFVALKVIRPNLIANEMALKRFHREAKAAAQLAHPNIVRLFDADQIGDKHFLAMEFVEGTDLADLIRDTGPLPIGMACSFMRQAAAGLQHAHDQGLVHRDIKPSNLLVTTPPKNGKTGSGGAIKILDMGLARVADAAGGDSAETALTQTGTVIGTPDYMSPEQAKNSSTVDARSDLYSLGCTFYYLLTGHAPFPTGSTLEKLLQHQMDAPKHVQLVRNDVPNEVAAIIHTLLAKKPEERFQNGAALAQALEPWSIFDSANARLTGATAPTAVVRAAIPLDEATPQPAPTEADPFNFEGSEVVPLGPTRVDAEPLPLPKNQKPVWWIVGAVAGLGLLIGGVFIARSLAKKTDSPPTPNEQVNQDKNNPNPKVIPPPAKREMEAIDAYLPADAELVAILNVPQLARPKYIQDSKLPQLAEWVKNESTFDPLTGVERVIAVVSGSDRDHPLLIVQGPNALPEKFVNWVSALEGVTSKDEKVPGVGPHRIYTLPDNKKGEPSYGAILQENPFSVAISSKKERVIEAVAKTVRRGEPCFVDLSLKTALARYAAKSANGSSPTPPTLWLGLAADSKLFAAIGKPKLDKVAALRETGVHAIYATLRLGDNLEFDMYIEADAKFQAEAFSKRINFFFKTLTDNNKDPRLDRLARLFSFAREMPRNKSNVNLHHWNNTIPGDELDEWFGVFFKGDGEGKEP